MESDRVSRYSSGVRPASRPYVESMSMAGTKSEPLSPSPTAEKRREFFGCSVLESMYITEGVIGEGTFGKVFRGIHKPTKQVVALKNILVHSSKDGFPVTSLREIIAMKELHHTNTMPLIEMAVKNDLLKSKIRKNTNSMKAATQDDCLDPFFMVTPYMSYDLTGLLENPNVHLQIPHIKCFMKQLLLGVEYIHASGYMHRDIKASNLLIDAHGVLKIGDFGLARKYKGSPPAEDIPGGQRGSRTKYTALVVTRWYRAPELVLGDACYTTAVDMWSVGCVFGEMFKKKPILQGSSEVDQGHRIFRLVGGPFDLNSWADLPNWAQYEKEEYPLRGTLEADFAELDTVSQSLLRGLLRLNPETRLTAGKALQHPIFTTEPLPCGPEDIPRFEESHEKDVKKFDTLRKSTQPSGSHKPLPFASSYHEPHRPRFPVQAPLSGSQGWGRDSRVARESREPERWRMGGADEAENRKREWGGNGGDMANGPSGGLKKPRGPWNA